MVSKNKQAGFTLIEIIFVLAIAALIMLIVFLAVSQAQMTTRNQKREAAVQELMADVLTWQANNGGQVITSQAQMDDVVNHYWQNKVDPSTNTDYTVVFRNINGSHSDIPPVGTIYYQIEHWCNRGPQSRPENPSDPISGDDTDLSKYVAWTGLEPATGGNNPIYCQDVSAGD